MAADRNAQKEEVRDLIRKGTKTSAIIALNRWPVDLIKGVKSEELENDKRLERERVKGEAQVHMAGKRAIHHQRFLDRMGIKENVGDLENVKPGAETTVQAPAQGAQMEQGQQSSDATGAGAEG